MPTPTALSSGAASKTRQAMPARCSINPSVNPPMPAPMMSTSMRPNSYSPPRDDHAPQAATTARKNDNSTS